MYSPGDKTYVLLRLENPLHSAYSAQLLYFWLAFTGLVGFAESTPQASCNKQKRAALVRRRNKRGRLRAA